MSRLLTVIVLATAVTFMSGAAHAQFKGWGDNDNRDKKTGRTEDGAQGRTLKSTSSIERKPVRQTPHPRADPWGDVRAVLDARRATRRQGKAEAAVTDAVGAVLLFANSDLI